MGKWRQQRALALANDPKNKPSLFANLHRIFTYEDRKAERDRTHQFPASPIPQATPSTHAPCNADSLSANPSIPSANPTQTTQIP